MQLPQNLKETLKEVGENSVLLKLFIYKSKDWHVYKNFDGVGYDLLLVHKVSNRQLKIEVKTRQNEYTNPKTAKNRVDFDITPLEHSNCDFLIALWFEKNQYYIVPKKDLVLNSKKTKYRYYAGEPGTPTYKINLKHLDQWSLIK